MSEDTSANSEVAQKKGVCPRCGGSGDLDPDGFWCPTCEDYWDKKDYEQNIDEAFDQDDHDCE